MDLAAKTLIAELKWAPLVQRFDKILYPGRSLPTACGSEVLGTHFDRQVIVVEAARLLIDVIFQRGW